MTPLVCAVSLLCDVSLHSFEHYSVVALQFAARRPSVAKVDLHSPPNDSFFIFPVQVQVEIGIQLEVHIVNSINVQFKCSNVSFINCFVAEVVMGSHLAAL